jgi:hypothetical protein
MKGWLTKMRYRVSTIFVDHFSGLSYIHLQKSTNAEETVEAKIAFERFASKVNVTIKSYQADNGQFAENKFMEDVKEAGQTMHNLLWSQRSLPECSGRKEDQDLTRSSKDHVDSCTAQVAQGY